MKAILEFNLPEDKEQYEVAHKAARLFQALCDFNELLFEVNNEEQEYVILYEDKKHIEIQELIKMWDEILDDNDITLNEMN